MINADELYYRKLNIPSGDLRISITNGCNMKCIYCHNEGQDSAQVRFLSPSDIIFIIRQSIKYGVNKVRLTGGEPTIHPEFDKIIFGLSNLVKIDNIGINTNAIEKELIIDACKKGYLNHIVIGIDSIDGKVSKSSSIGLSSSEVLDTVLILKELHVNVQIASVLTRSNSKQILELVGWCIEHHILLKIIEETSHYSEASTTPADDYFEQLILSIRDKYFLHLGITIDLGEYYLYDGINRVLFFQSHCNRNECEVCRNLHLRIDVDGNARTCIWNNVAKFPLLDGHFDFQMKRAIINQGRAPWMELL